MCMLLQQPAETNEFKSIAVIIRQSKPPRLMIQSAGIAVGLYEPVFVLWAGRRLDLQKKNPEQ